MIIKSWTRKNNSFGQIVNYVFKNDQGSSKTFTYIHNMDGCVSDCRKSIIANFRDNSSYKKKRKNGVTMYHECISFSNKDSKWVCENPQFIYDTCNIYFSIRCPNAIGIAKPHLDKDHVHIHFIISANEKESQRSTRISKSEFSKIKRNMTLFQDRYKELRYSYRHSASHESRDVVNMQSLELERERER